MSGGGNGTLFLVVGPSGAGKDSLIGAARERLADDPRFWFPRRVITRPADSGSESHIEAAPAEFEDLRRRGGFAMTWDSHGLRYGIPAEIVPRLAAGVHVVVNVSRGVVAACRSDFDAVAVVHITATRETLARRLVARGREREADVAARLARAGAPDIDLGDTIEIDNSGDLDAAVARFLDALRTAPHPS